MSDPTMTTQEFDIETLISRAGSVEYKFEYNCDMRRIYPWPGIANTKRPITEFGLVWVEVRPGTDVDAHEHDEEETFMILSGAAEVHLEGRVARLGVGDVIYIPRMWRHQMRNPFSERLVFADIYWDHKGRSAHEWDAR